MLIPVYPLRYSLHEKSVLVALGQLNSSVNPINTWKFHYLPFTLVYSAAQTMSLLALLFSKLRRSSVVKIWILLYNMLGYKLDSVQSTCGIWKHILTCGKQMCAVIRRVEHILISNISNPHQLWSPRGHWKDLQRLLNPLKMQNLNNSG